MNHTSESPSFLQLQYRVCHTIATKEIRRIVRIWKVTVMPPIINTYLFCLVFGQIIGSRLGLIEGLTYLQFIVPGLIMNIVINESFSNCASSILIDKYHKAMDDLVVAPAHAMSILVGYLLGGMFRAFLSGLFSALLGYYLAGIELHNPFILAYAFVITSIVFSLLGMINGLYAKRFDELTTIPTFILTPLSFFGGVFYDIRRLPHPWDDLSWFNPIVYMVDSFRFGSFGVDFHDYRIALAVITLLALFLFFFTAYLLKTGFGLRK